MAGHVTVIRGCCDVQRGICEALCFPAAPLMVLEVIRTPLWYLVQMSEGHSGLDHRSEHSLLIDAWCDTGSHRKKLISIRTASFGTAV